MSYDPQILYPILRYFTHAHLPEHLQAISRPFCELAWEMTKEPPINCAAQDETAEGLRDLLRAKDCFVRAAVA